MIDLHETKYANCVIYLVKRSLGVVVVGGVGAGAWE